MTTLVTPDRDFDRDRYGRPLIIPAGGGKPCPYRRCTSFVDVNADKYGLQQWEKRQVAIGLAQRDDLRLNVLAHLDELLMRPDVFLHAGAGYDPRFNIHDRWCLTPEGVERAAAALLVSDATSASGH